MNPNQTASAALKERSRFDAEPSSPTAWGDLSGESAGDKKQAAPRVNPHFFYEGGLWWTLPIRRQA